LKRFLLLLLTVAFYCSLFGQNNTLDLQQMSSAQLFQNMVKNTRENPEFSIKYATALLERSLINKQKDTAALAYIYLGRAHRVNGDEKNAIKFINKGIAFVKNNNLNQSYLAQLYLTKGNNLSDLGASKDALAILFEGLEIANKNNDEKNGILINNSISYIYYVSDELEKAKKIQLKIIKQLNKIEFLDVDLFSISYKARIALSRIYLLQKKLDSALLVNNEGLQRVLTTNDIFTTAGFYDTKGIIELEKGAYNEALISFTKSLEFSEKIGNGNTIMPTKFNLATYFYKKGNFNETITLLEDVLKITKRDSLQYPEIPDVYKLLAKSYTKTNNLIKANENFEAHILSLKLSEKDKNSVTKAIYNKEIKNLNKQKTIQNNKLLIIIVFISLIVFGLLIIIFRSYKIKKKNEVKFQKLLQKVTSSQNKKEHVIDTKDVELEATNTSEISEEIKHQILQGLQLLETQEYFLRSSCNSYNVAKKIKTNTSYLSKVINSHYQKNFNTYINDLRINYAIIRLKNDSKFRSFSIQSIAEELGYKSADSFSKYFKLDTGLNPSFYIKQLNALD
jgi:AraC-like DNA-binding protein/Tfp pilus assembly protein PilF